MSATTHPGEIPADILVVDDTQANLQLLSGMLKERGYKVRPAPSGAIALQAARSAPPDLILLDINMPEMDGYEVCTQLKQDERTADVPVIFISALNETMDKVRAFAVGGVDYVTKPFQFEEVNARVTAHLKIRHMQVDLENLNAELLDTNAELVRLQQLRDNLTHMIVHDLRSPLSGVMGTYDLLAMDADKLSAPSAKMLELSKPALKQMLEMINSLLDVSKIEAGELKPNRSDCDLVILAHHAASVLGGVCGGRSVTVDSAAEQMPASVDRELISRVLQNLLGNALKFTPKDGHVKIQITRVPDRARISVIDNGPGIPPEFHERIFEKFGQVTSDRPRVGTGLGLTFCRLAVEAHGGKIGVASEVGKGSTFWFELPDS